jgi:O-antigen ligase
MKRTIHRIMKSNKSMVVMGLLLMYCSFLYKFPDDFKVGLVVTMVFIALLHYVIRNLFLSILIVFIASASFLFPAKTYTFEYASPSLYRYELLPRGIVESITFSISDVLGFSLVLLFIRQRVSDKLFIAVLNRPVVTAIIASWFVYYACSLYASINYSVFPIFSVDVLMLSGKMVLVFIGIIYLFSMREKNSFFIYIVLLSILLFQSLVGIVQFGTSFSSSGAIEQKILLDVEENIGFSRVSGISFHPNSHALTTSLLMLFTLPYVVREKGKKWWVILLFGFINIILSQSRTIWLACIIPALLAFIIHFKSQKEVLMRIAGNKRIISMTLVVMGMFLLIVFPRIGMTSIFFSQEGGGVLRTKMTIEGWELLQQVPWTGYGVGTGVRIFLDKLPNSYATTFPFPVHFALLQIALESGIPGVIAFLIPIVLVARLHFGSDLRKRLRDHRTLSIVSCIIVLMVFYSFQPIFTRREYLYIGICIGLGVAWKKHFTTSI